MAKSMRIKKWITGILVMILCAGFMGGCDTFSPKFTDYNVSGYIGALLNSSYKGNHDAFINFTQSTPVEAQDNNTLTVENGAIHLCNAFGLYPTDDQMVQLQEIVKEAYSQTDFTVKSEEKTTEGYSVQVDIKPLVTFRELTASFEEALNKVENGELKVESSEAEEVSGDGESSAVESGEGEEESKESSADTETKGIDQHTLFVDEVIRICKEALKKNPQYDPFTTITMNINLDEEGVLYLDRTQLEEIDETVILFRVTQAVS